MQRLSAAIRSSLTGALALLVTLGLGLPLESRATVNTEAIRGLAPSDGWSGFTEGSLLLKTGNEDLWQTGLGLRLQHATFFEHRAEQPSDGQAASSDPPRWLRQSWLVVGQLNIGKKGGESFLNNGFTHARWTRMWVPSAGTELFTQHQFNKFLRLDTRFLVGSNARLILLNGSSTFLAAGTGYMLEFESLNGENTASDLFHRWNNYLSFKTSIGEAAQLSSTFYFQPRFDALADFRALSENELEVKLVGNLSLATVLKLAHDNRPPSSVGRQDAEVLQKLRYSF